MATVDREQERTVTTTLPVKELYYAEPSPHGAGWVLFSAIALGIAGAWAVIEGILAVTSSKIYVANTTFVFSDLRTWGWIMTGLGIATALAALAVFTGSELARWFGIAVAGLYAIGQLLFIQANQWWSIAMFAVAILAIYGLAAYGGSRLKKT